MGILESVLMGVVQGLTEFLPVSSSGHLVLIPYFFSIQDPGLAFDVALHMGTLSAILYTFRADWVAMFFEKRQRSRLLIIAMATVPAVLAGLLLEKRAETAFRDPRIIAFTLIVFGAALGFADQRGKKQLGINDLSIRSAMLIGVAQAMAIVPGVSRSGVTITAALLLGFSRNSAMRFSFLLSAPIIAGAGLLKIGDVSHWVETHPGAGAVVASGFLASLVSGIAALWILDRLTKTKTLMPFVYYRAALGLFIIVTVIFR
jgi:undecaprenyl-diphosphatase